MTYLILLGREGGEDCRCGLSPELDLDRGGVEHFVGFEGGCLDPEDAENNIVVDAWGQDSCIEDELLRDVCI